LVNVSLFAISTGFVCRSGCENREKQMARNGKDQRAGSCFAVLNIPAKKVSLSPSRTSDVIVINGSHFVKKPTQKRSFLPLNGE
jgi:hypothetical protein